jgi:hypothetical protein
MKNRISAAAAVSFLATAASLVATGVAQGAAAPVPQQFCQVQFVAGGAVYAGSGMSVTSSSGRTLNLCRVTVTPPPETVVTTFPDTRGNIVIVTRSGAAVVVFHSG